ncbi:LysR family transcriptional regulator [Gammaproteobacteria bacterium]|jgi:DNA-binding transcriptional LysR family regulator|nr:LysR family transcriptional regulator [Gammaproteobacteria bacterium]
MLSSKQIEIFYEVYKNSSMTAAANKMQISQPSISKTLAAVEKNLGFKLFLRKGKKLIPTNEAVELFEQASIVTNQLKNFNYIANTYKSRSLDFINIGTTPSLAETLVPKIIKKYNLVKPDTRFNLINLNSIDLIEERYKPDIDITICFNARSPSNSKNIIIKEGKHFLVSPKKYNLKKEIYLKDVLHIPYIEITNLLSLYSESSIMNYFIKNELSMNFYFKSDSYSAALSIINEGIGMSILDDNTTSKADKNLVNISNIIDTEFTYQVNAIIKNDIASTLCNDFFNYLSEQSQLSH